MLSFMQDFVSMLLFIVLQIMSSEMCSDQVALYTDIRLASVTHSVCVTLCDTHPASHHSCEIGLWCSMVFGVEI